MAKPIVKMMMQATGRARSPTRLAAAHLKHHLVLVLLLQGLLPQPVVLLHVCM